MGMETEKILQALREVIDPELGVNIVELGLVYEVRRDIDVVRVRMTLTTPGCPLGGYFLEEVSRAAANGAGVETENVEVEFVFDPPWTPEMMSEEARATLGFD